jgi:hypothetical protein
MKKLFIFIALFAFNLSPFTRASAQGIPVITSWMVNTTGLTGYSGITANVQTDQFDSNNVYISCSDIPSYSIGPWPSDPNIPKNQNFVFKITRNPVQNTGTLDSVGLGQICLFSDGVVGYSSSDAMTYNNDGIWHRNAYYFEGVSFDACLGHPDPNGAYHQHVNPKCLYNDQDSTQHSPLIGYAFDGFPVYGAYGYASALNASSGIKRMTPSYQARTKMVNRDTLPNGTILASANYGPAVSASYPLGDFMEDYTYVASSGDLDDRNGRYCVTPEYPSGIYAYFITIDSKQNPVFPYILGYTYFGTVQAGNTPPTGGHNTIPSGTKVYTPTGINEVNQGIKFQFEPNPVTDFAYIYLDLASENNITATLYNVEGQLLNTFTNWHAGINYKLDMSAYPAGIYLLHLQTENTSVVQKIVKVK